MQPLPECEHGFTKAPSDLYCPQCAACVWERLQVALGERDAALTEVARLKRGDFTPDELQELCHNLTTDDACAFVRGCRAYQEQLFGLERTVKAHEEVEAAEDCPECNGAGGRYKYPSDDPLNKLMSGDHWYRCSVCNGTGKTHEEVEEYPC